MEIIPLFSIPLYTTVLESLPEKEKNFIFNTKYKRSGWNNGDISLDTKILDSEECVELRLIIEKELERFIDALGIRPNLEFCIKNSWAVRHHKNDWSQSHIHSNSLFSGVLYLKVNSNSGNINFRKNQGSGLGITSIRIPYSESNIFNLDTYIITPVDNQLVLFPSTLQHSVDINMSENERYVLSFNVFPVGKLGDDSSLDELYLYN
jgi:uncharacterized protein (TIGR02466 family)